MSDSQKTKKNQFHSDIFGCCVDVVRTLESVKLMVTIPMAKSTTASSRKGSKLCYGECLGSEEEMGVALNLQTSLATGICHTTALFLPCACPSVSCVLGPMSPCPTTLALPVRR